MFGALGARWCAPALRCDRRCWAWLLDGVESGIYWAIGDGYSAGDILVGANDWHWWCLPVFAVYWRFFGVQCDGRAW